MKSKKLLITCAILILAGIIFTPSCPPKQILDCTIEGPQAVVNPGTVRLSFAALVKSKITFNGCGFNPGDSILIEMLAVPVNGKKTDLAIANAQIEEDGTFEADIGPVTKISEFMRAKIDAINNIIIIQGEPMPEGTYDIRVSSLMSDTIAKCTLSVEGPALIDRIKDLLGRLLGKIVEKEETQK